MNDSRKSEEINIAAGHFLKEREYWLKKLSGKPESTHIMYDEPWEKTQERFMETLTSRFPGDVFTKLLKLSNNSDAGLFIILVTAVVVLLAKYTGSKDIIIGTTIDKQEADGEFINTVLPLRNRLEEDMIFKTLLLQVRQTIIEANDNQNYPVEKLAHDMIAGTLPGEERLFDIAILLQGFHDRSYIRHIQPEMLFLFTKEDGNLRLDLEYNAARYCKQRVEKAAEHLSILLKDAINHPDLPVNDLQILSQEDKEQLLFGFNDTAGDYPRDTTLHRLFAEQAGKTPDALALIETDGIQSISYRQLERESGRWAAFLRKKGVSPGRIMAVMMQSSIGMVKGITAILTAGGAFLPIDPTYPWERLTYMMRDSSANLLLTNRGYYKEAEKLRSMGIETIYAEEMGGLIGQDSDWVRDACMCPETGLTTSRPHDPSNPCYVIYTSGSTGKPKGVMIRYSSIVNQLVGLLRRFDFYPLMRHILLAPVTFDPSVQQMLLPILTGGTCHLTSVSMRSNAQELLNFVTAKRIDVLNTVPSLMSALLNMRQLTQQTGNPEKITFKYVILAGEVFSKELYLKLVERFAVEKIINIYGPTEATINTTLYECDPEVESKRTRLPIGKPLMNYRTYILNPDFNVLPIGVPGELCISGEGLAEGYINQPELTAEKFVNLASQLLYKTGDLARWLPDGNIDFLGRIDSQVKVRGFRIEPGEIDSLLFKLDGITDSLTIVRETPAGRISGDGDNNYLCSYIVTESDQRPGNSEIKKYLDTFLPGYMIPTYFMPVETIPVTASGKVDRNALPEPGIHPENDCVPPRNEVEEKLVEIWANVLGLQRIGIRDNFFQIGGDSIKVIKLLNLINDTLGTGLNVVDLYVHGTIEDLSENLDAYRKKDDDRELKEVLSEIEKLKDKFIKGT
jgi:amino acid adenylation domain-containing protein